MNDATANALANEALRQTAKQAIASLQGRIDNASSLIAVISSTLTDAQKQLDSKTVELTAIESGAGPGITDDWGERTAFINAFVTKAQAAGLITADTLAAFQALI